MTALHRLLVVVLVVAACSSDESAADRPSAGGPTTEPSATDSAPETTTAAPDADDSTTGPERDPTPDLASLAGSIVIRNEPGELVVIDPTGERIEVLTERGSVQSQPTWSNDAGTLAWTTATSSGGVVVVAELGSGERVDFDLTPPPFYFSWAPDDSLLAALRPTPRGIELGVFEDDGYRALGSGQPFFFTWNPDGETITAAVGGRSYGTIDPALETQDVVRDADLSLFQTPLVLADGSTYLPFATDADGGFELVRIDGDDRDVVATGTGALAMSANPVDDRLALITGVGGEPEAVVIGLAFDDPVDLERGTASVLDLASGEIIVLPIERPVGMQWSPDGTRLLVFEASRGELVVHYVDGATVEEGPRFAPTAEFAQSYLPFLDQYNHSVRWWSPDSRAVVLSGTIAGVFGVFVDIVDDDLPPQRIASGDIGVWSPR